MGCPQSLLSKDADADRTQNARFVADDGEGDVVSSGDILAEIETDKATMEFEAVDEGTISKILVAEGSDGVKVGTPIAVLTADGEETSAAPTTPKHDETPAPTPSDQKTEAAPIETEQ